MFVVDSISDMGCSNVVFEFVSGLRLQWSVPLFFSKQYVRHNVLMWDAIGVT